MNNPHQMAHQLRRAEHAMTIMLEKALQPVGVTPSQGGVLLYIDRYTEVTMAKLANIVAITPQTMHRIIISLEQRGLIQRKRKKENKKSFYVSLTLEGVR